MSIALTNSEASQGARIICVELPPFRFSTLSMPASPLPFLTAKGRVNREFSRPSRTSTALVFLVDKCLGLSRRELPERIFFFKGLSQSHCRKVTALQHAWFCRYRTREQYRMTIASVVYVHAPSIATVLGFCDLFF